MKNYYCLEHDEKMIPVSIDENGEIETDTSLVSFEENGLACPEDECTVVIYEGE